MSRARTLGTCALLASAGSAALAVAARGEPLDPTLPLHVRLGEPMGAGAAPGSSSGTARSHVPDNPRVLWQARVRGSADAGPAVDARGKILVASPGRLSQLSSSGKLEFSVRIPGRAAVRPVLTSDGTRLVASSDGMLTAVTEWGSVQYQRQLEGLQVPRVLVADRDGGALLGTAAQIVRVDRHGLVLASTPVPGGVLAILRTRDRTWLVEPGGDVSEWSPSAELRRAGDLGGKPGRAALSGDHLVLGVVDHGRITELDLRTGAHRVRVADLGAPLDGSLAVGPHGTWARTIDQQLVAHDHHGRERARVPLDPAPTPLDGGSAVVTETPPLDPVVDLAGSVALARSGEDLALVSPSGDLQLVMGVACDAAVGLALAPGRRLVLVCRSGTVWMLGDAERDLGSLPGPDDGSEPPPDLGSSSRDAVTPESPPAASAR